MSIYGHSRREPAPAYVIGFETAEEWSACIGERFFSSVTPNEPFLLIARRIEHDSTGHTVPATWMRKDYYVGFLADEGPLTGCTEPVEGSTFTQGFFLTTRRFVCFPDVYRDGKLKSESEGQIIFQFFGMHYTPVSKPFKPPFSIGRSHELFDAEVEAFSIACGIEAMEALAIEESAWDKDFLPWYARSVKYLDIPLVLENLREVQLGEYRKILRRLRQQDAIIMARDARVREIHRSIGIPRIQNGALSIIEDETLARLMSYADRQEIQKLKDRILNNLRAAKKLGMLEDFTLLDIDGHRCQPAIVIEDFCRLYNFV